MEKKLVLTEYEAEALEKALKDQMASLDSQAREVAKSRHLDNEKKKEVKRTLSKRAHLLSEILKKVIN